MASMLAALLVQQHFAAAPQAAELAHEHAVLLAAFAVDGDGDSSDELAALRAQLSSILDCYCEYQFSRAKSFESIRAVMVQPRHAFVQALSAALRAAARRALACWPSTSPSPSPAPSSAAGTASDMDRELFPVIQRALWQRAQRLMALPGELEHQVLAEFVATQSAGALALAAAPRFLSLPAIEVNLSRLSNDPAHRTPLLHSILQHTLRCNGAQIEALRPELADALGKERRAVYEQLAPLERSNALLGSLLHHWHDASFSLPDAGMDSMVLLQPMEVAVLDELPLLPEPLRRTIVKYLGSLDSVGSQLRDALRTVESVSHAATAAESFDIDTLPADIANIQRRIARLQSSLRELDEFLSRDPELEAPLAPLKVALYYARRELVDEMADVDRELLSSSSSSSSSSDATEHAAELKDEMAFLRKLASRWDRRKKILTKRDCWLLPIRARSIAFASLEPEHRRAYRIEQAGLRCRIATQTADILVSLEKKIAKAVSLLQWGAALGVWSAEQMRREVLWLEHAASWSLDDLLQHRAELKPDVTAIAERAIAIADKYQAAETLALTASESAVAFELPSDESSQFHVPPLELSLTRIDRSLAEAILNSKREVLSQKQQQQQQQQQQQHEPPSNNTKKPTSKKSTSSKTAKSSKTSKSSKTAKSSKTSKSKLPFKNAVLDAEVNTLVHQTSFLAALLAEWESRSSICESKSISTITTEPRTCQVSEISKEERRALQALGKQHKKTAKQAKKLADSARKQALKEYRSLLEQRLSLLRPVVHVLSHPLVASSTTEPLPETPASSSSSSSSSPSSSSSSSCSSSTQLIAQASAQLDNLDLLYTRVAPTVGVLAPHTRVTSINEQLAIRTWERATRLLLESDDNGQKGHATTTATMTTATATEMGLRQWLHAELEQLRHLCTSDTDSSSGSWRTEGLSSAISGVLAGERASVGDGEPSIHPSAAAGLMTADSEAMWNGTPESQSPSLSALSTLERQGMVVLSRALHRANGASVAGDRAPTFANVMLNGVELAQLLALLEHAQANLALNATVSLMAKVDSIPFGISEDAVWFMRTFSFKSKHLDLLEPLAVKLVDLWRRISADVDGDGDGDSSGSSKKPRSEPISVREKLTLSEVGIARSLCKWTPDLLLLERLLGLAGTLDEPVAHRASQEQQQQHQHQQQQQQQLQLERWRQRCQSARALCNAMRQIHDRISNEPMYESGDLLLILWSRKQKTKQDNRPPAHFRFMMSFTKYEHTAVIYRNAVAANGPLGECRLSHMIRAYHDTELAIEDIACAEVYRLQVAALVTRADVRQSLQSKYGEQWPAVVQQHFARIEAELHSMHQEVLNTITNPMSRVMNLGTATVMPWRKRAKRAEDFALVRQQLFATSAAEGAADGAEPGQLQMTCSEFALKSFVASLLELEELLKRELDGTLATAAAAAPLLSIPFPTKERMETIKPERLREMLLDKKALRLLETPSYITDLVDLRS